MQRNITETDEGRGSSLAQQAGTLVVVAAGYFLAARIGLALVPSGSHLAIIWPPSGLAVAAFLLVQGRRWAAVCAGILTANIAANLAFGHGGAVSFLYAAVNVLEPLLIAAALRRWCGGLDFSTQRRTALFFSVVAAGAALTAAAGAAVPALAYGDPFGPQYLHWLVADSVGIFVVTPLLLLGRDAGRSFSGAVAPLKRAEFVGLLLVIAVLSYFHVHSEGGTITFAVLNLTVLMRMSFSFGAPGVAVGIALQSALMIQGVSRGGGYLFGDSRSFESAAVGVQLFVVAAATASYVVTAAFDGQRRLYKQEQERAAQLLSTVTSLRQSESRLRQAQRIGMMGNWEFDVASGKLWWSDEVYQLFGLGRNGGISFERFIGIVHPDDRQRVQEGIRASVELCMTAWQFDYRILREDGEVRFVSESATADVDAGGRIVSRRGIVQDVTGMRVLEEQLRQAQKMEAVGTLAGGIAHDFNNILNVIKGYGFLLARGAAPQSPLSGHVSEIVAACNRGVDLTSSLLAFSRPRESLSAVIDLNVVVSGMRSMIVRILGEDVRPGITLAPEALQVAGDAGQIGQVLMNLASNARDAMPRGGRLDITTTTLALPPKFLREDMAPASGPYAVLRVSDSGQGMTEEVRRRIFEPFFSTKEVGRGTGLGLAVVFGIVKQHQGFVECASAPGAGATFTVYLPLSTEIRSDDVSADASAAIPRGGGEHLLLAEDDEAGRMMLSMILKDDGYRVTAARDGSEVLALFAADPDGFALLILDLVMPNGTGLDVLDRARRLRPGMPAILMSGYSDEVIKEKGLTLASIPILRKPIVVEEFLGRIRETLVDAQQR